MTLKLTSSLVFALVSASALIAADAAQAGCSLYQHRDYGGARYRMGDNTSVVMAAGAAMCWSSSHGGGGGCQDEAPDWNDQVSSFKVSAGCQLTLFQHINGGGARFVRSNSVKYVGSAWNDQASQADCDC